MGALLHMRPIRGGFYGVLVELTHFHYNFRDILHGGVGGLEQLSSYWLRPGTVLLVVL